MKKKCVAMLLAGGQGSRLGVLTTHRAKPAVPYGGRYRIIDFPLSNCCNSGIDTVGVLTQYQPLELNSYIGTGAPWDLDGMNGGTFVLPPYVAGKKGEWYSGTANAIYQNRNFIDSYDPEYILVLSGDHIYKMDYSAMIEFHVKKGADATIAVIEVPIEEASRFGIMNTDDDLRIVEFEEKPEVPKSNKASMGVYVFTWSVVKEYLKRDNEMEDTSNDFGKNIIPAMLDGGEAMYAYPFKGYWKDVGTVQSLWEANMELLLPDPALDLHDENWKIYSKNPNKPPHFIGGKAMVHNSIISEGCHVYGNIQNSILFPGVVVQEGAEIKDSIIMQNSVIGHGTAVYKSIIDEGGQIGDKTVIGDESEITVIGNHAYIGDGCRIMAGTTILPGMKVNGEVE